MRLHPAGKRRRLWHSSLATEDAPEQGKGSKEFGTNVMPCCRWVPASLLTDAGCSPTRTKRTPPFGALPCCGRTTRCWSSSGQESGDPRSLCKPPLLPPPTSEPRCHPSVRGSEWLRDEGLEQGCAKQFVKSLVCGTLHRPCFGGCDAVLRTQGLLVRAVSLYISTESYRDQPTSPSILCFAAELHDMWQDAPSIGSSRVWATLCDPGGRMGVYGF